MPPLPELGRPVPGDGKTTYTLADMNNDMRPEIAPSQKVNAVEFILGTTHGKKGWQTQRAMPTGTGFKRLHRRARECRAKVFVSTVAKSNAARLLEPSRPSSSRNPRPGRKGVVPSSGGAPRARDARGAIRRRRRAGSGCGHKFIDAVLQELDGAEEIKFGPPQDVCKSGTWYAAAFTVISMETAASTFAARAEIKRVRLRRMGGPEIYFHTGRSLPAPAAHASSSTNVRQLQARQQSRRLPAPRRALHFTADRKLRRRRRRATPAHCSVAYAAMPVSFRVVTLPRSANTSTAIVERLRPALDVVGRTSSGASARRGGLARDGSGALPSPSPTWASMIAYATWRCPSAGAPWTARLPLLAAEGA